MPALAFVLLFPSLTPAAPVEEPSTMTRPPRVSELIVGLWCMPSDLWADGPHLVFKKNNKVLSTSHSMNPDITLVARYRFVADQVMEVDLDQAVERYLVEIQGDILTLTELTASPKNVYRFKKVR